MDCFSECDGSIPSFVLKEQAGFGKGGEKNFDGILANLKERFPTATEKEMKKVIG